MSNYLTPGELGEVASIANALDELLGTVDEVSWGDVPLFDTNGESIGLLRYEDGHKFYPQYNW